MTHIDQHGIVIKRHFPYKNAIAVFDAEHGLFTGSTQPYTALHSIWPGMVVTYNRRSKNNYVTLQHPSIITAPPVTSERHLAWLHHALEIVAYCAPPAHPCSRLFSTLTHLVTTDPQHFDTPIMRQASIMNLLLTLGYYPEHFSSHLVNAVIRIASMTPEEAGKAHTTLTTIALLLDNAIDRWIIECLRTHPAFDKLKTIVS